MQLQSLLIERATRWAHEVAPGRAIVVTVRAAAHADGKRRAREVAAAFAAFEPGAPLLLAGEATVRLGPGHAADALSDLAQGSDVSFGPAHDGGYYLLALARPAPSLFELPAQTWGGPLVLPRTIEAAAKLGLAGGLLRMERQLVTPADAMALLVDPLTPAPIRDLLAAGEFARLS